MLPDEDLLTRRLRAVADGVAVPIDLGLVVRRGRSARRRRVVAPLAVVTAAASAVPLLAPRWSGAPQPPVATTTTEAPTPSPSSAVPTPSPSVSPWPGALNVPEEYLTLSNRLGAVMQDFPDVSGDLRWVTERRTFQVEAAEGADRGADFRAAIADVPVPDGYGVEVVVTSPYPRAMLNDVAQTLSTSYVDWAPAELQPTFYGVSGSTTEGTITFFVDETRLDDWRDLLARTDLGVDIPVVVEPGGRVRFDVGFLEPATRPSTSD